MFTLYWKHEPYYGQTHSAIKYNNFETALNRACELVRNRAKYVTISEKGKRLFKGAIL